MNESNVAKEKTTGEIKVLNRQSINESQQFIKNRMVTLILRSLQLGEDNRKTIEEGVTVKSLETTAEEDVSFSCVKIAELLKTDPVNISSSIAKMIAPKPRVIVESPYTGNVEVNTRYARACMDDCIKKGEAPIAFHTLYTQHGVLNDDIPNERGLGLMMSDEWRTVAHKTVIYTDLGVSKGMKEAIEHATMMNQQIEYRTIKDFMVAPPLLLK